MVNYLFDINIRDHRDLRAILFIYKLERHSDIRQTPGEMT